MRAVTCSQLLRVKKEIEKQPRMTATQGCELLAAHFDITPRYVRKLFELFDLHWEIPAVPDECEMCGGPVFSKHLCTAHYFQERRRKDKEKMEKAEELANRVYTKPCFAVLPGDKPGKHEWVRWQERTVCARCRETEESVSYKLPQEEECSSETERLSKWLNDTPESSQT